MPQIINTTPSRQHGVTLFEVMIALLVLSIGLLGLASLQTSAFRSGQVADMHHQAVRLAHDISERMQANPGGHYTLARKQLPSSTGASGIARADLLSWGSQLADLPGGLGEIQPCTPATRPACPDIDGQRITVYWNAARDPAVSRFNCPPKSSSDYRCYQLVSRSSL